MTITARMICGSGDRKKFFWLRFGCLDLRVWACPSHREGPGGDHGGPCVPGHVEPDV